MTKKFPPAPKNPQRVCWGCDQYCAASDMRCGNGSDRTPHPVELFGDDWQDWAPAAADSGATQAAAPSHPTGTHPTRTSQDSD